MPDDTTTVETTTDTAAQDVAPVTETPTPDSAPDEEPFDPVRAKALIAKLRPFEKEAKNLKKELDEAKQALREYEDEKLSETDRLQKQVDELKPVAEKFTQLEQELERSNKALETYVATLREGLPQSVLVLLDGRPLPDQLEWLTQNRDEVLGQKSAPEKPKGVPASPKASGNGIPDDEKRRRAANTWRG